jgi:CheY-like chemotaxis protein
MLADDMAQFLDLELSFLRRADCQIITAADGAQALVLAKQEKPDLLLLDVEMPRMTGIEVCRLLRQDPAFKTTPIVMVTSTNRRDEALAAGATDFWRKPIKEVQFLEGIRRLVDIKIREDERFSVGLPATVVLPDGKTVDGMTRDVSATGAFILAGVKVATDTEVKVRISLGFDKAPQVEIDGFVARVQSGADGGVGVRFLGPEHAVKRLRDYVQTL